MKYVLLIIFFIHGWAQASMIGYGDQDCRLIDEKRGLLRGKEVCLQVINCFHYPLNNPYAGTRISTKAYCRPDSSNVCLDPQECLRDNSLQMSDIPHIKYKYESDESCECKDEESSSSSGGWPKSSGGWPKSGVQ